MLYLEKNDGRGKGWARVFSTTDSQRELDKFRCLVRAPRQALKIKKKDGERMHLNLFGKPRETAASLLAVNQIFETPIERIAWERTQPAIMKLHPSPYMEPK
jgi:hypothetical protein